MFPGKVLYADHTKLWQPCPPLHEIFPQIPDGVVGVFLVYGSEADAQEAGVHPECLTEWQAQEYGRKL